MRKKSPEPESLMSLYFGLAFGLGVGGFIGWGIREAIHAGKFNSSEGIVTASGSPLKFWGFMVLGIVMIMGFLLEMSRRIALQRYLRFRTDRIRERFAA
jgi:hypothetical protein